MKYVTRRPRAEYWDVSLDEQVYMPDTCTVIEDEDTPEYTGLFDINGNELCRVKERHPMGFRPK